MGGCCAYCTRWRKVTKVTNPNSDFTFLSTAKSGKSKIKNPFLDSPKGTRPKCSSLARARSIGTAREKKPLVPGVASLQNGFLLLLLSLLLAVFILGDALSVQTDNASMALLISQSRSQRPRSFYPTRWKKVTEALGTRLNV